MSIVTGKDWLLTIDGSLWDTGEPHPTIIVVKDRRVSAKTLSRCMLSPEPRVKKPYYRQFEKRSKKQCNK